MLNPSSALYQNLRWVKRYLTVPPLYANALTGYLWFLATGNTPATSLRALRKLFWITNSRFNDSWWAVAKILKPPRDMRTVNGVLGSLTPTDIERFAGALQKDGYFIFPQRISESICQELMNYALKNPATLSEVPPGQKNPGPVIYDPQNPLSPTYIFGNNQSLYECPAAQTLLMDQTFLAVAQAFFRAQPIVDFIDMWWSTAFLKGGSSPGASQWYHFDMNRIKFLKFFFYLTDVTTENGPHCFIKGSHRRKPHGLLRDGRVSDEEMAKYYGPEDTLEFTGPRGTILAEDTSGYHKGKGPLAGQRLIFQIQYTVSLFGNDYPKTVVNEKFSSQFIDFAKKYSHTFRHFTGIRR